MRSGRPRTPSAATLQISGRFSSRNDNPFISEAGKSRSLVRTSALANASLTSRSLVMTTNGGFASALAVLFLLVTLALGLGVVTPAAAQEDVASRRVAAEGQFQRAEAMRTALEAKTERERSVQDYENLVSAYRRVYLITPTAIQVPSAIKNVADLYRRMGEQFEPKYFNSAIETYAYLMREYPESSLREASLLAIAEIRRNNLSQADLALKIYQDFLDQYPRSSYGPQVHKAIAEIKAAAAKPKTAPVQAAAAPTSPRPASSSAASTSAAGGPAASSLAPSTSVLSTAPAGTNVTAGSAMAGSAASGNATANASAPGQSSEVSHVHIWNADNYTRIIIELGGKAKYQAARISDPDRIYFDIENAKLSNELLHQPIEIPSVGYLKAVRVAQNRADVVRVVLDVAKVKDYSVFELADPDRLIVDVYGPTDGTAAATAAPPPANSSGKTNVKSAALASAGTAVSTPAISAPAASSSIAPTARAGRIQTPAEPRNRFAASACEGVRFPAPDARFAQSRGRGCGSNFAIAKKPGR